jgi:DNA-binding winged helix-turn-helix (wHTH) protein/tetratricopeptide (TPR) repeat protein
MRSGCVDSRFRFGPFELDAAMRTLLREGAEVEIRPKPLALLLLLVRRRDQVVAAQQIFEALWPGVAVSDSALSTALRDLRRVLDEPGSGKTCIRTLRGRGYRFVLPVEEQRIARASDAPAGQAFVGRADLLAGAQDWLGDVGQGRGAAVLLAGEAGIGKTWALLEIARLAGARGFALHHARCLEEQAAPAYWPWVQILRGVIDDRPRPEELRQRFGTGFDAVLGLLGDTRGPQVSNAEEPGGAAARFQFFDTVTRVILAAAEQRPLALFLDDIHRADRSSLDLLRHLLGGIAGHRIFLAGSYRDTEVPDGHPLEQVLAGLHPSGRIWPLAGLDAEEVGELIRRLSGSVPEATTAAALQQRTGGNPLFVAEIARDPASRDSLAGTSAAPLPTPIGVRQVVRSRVGGLPAPAPQILEVAAAIGRCFDLDVLARVAEVDAAAVHAALETAHGAGLVVPDGDRAGRFGFRHILIRDALYESLSVSRVTELHRGIGMALEELRRVDLEPHVDELAHHFGRAAAHGEARRAMDYAQRAGARAHVQTAYHEAAERFAAALDAQALMAVDARQRPESLRESHRQRADLLVCLGRAQWCEGDVVHAREHFAAAAELARRAGAPELLTAAALGYAGRTDATPGVNRVAVALLEDALEALPDQDHALRAEALARLGTELYYDSDQGRCPALTQRAVEMGERLGDERVLCYALSARVYSMMRAEIDPRKRLALLRRQIDLAERCRADDVAAISYQQQVLTLLEFGDSVRLDLALLRLESIAEGLQQPFFQWMAGALRGMRLMMQGRIEAAERLAHRTLAIGQGFGTPNALPMFSIQIFFVRREQQRLHELVPVLRAAIEDQPIYVGLRTALATSFMAAGNREACRDTFEQVVSQDLDDFPRDQHWLSVLGTLAPLCRYLGDAPRARLIYGALRPFEGRMIQVAQGGACHGAVSHHLGLLASTFDDDDSAAAHFDAAVTLERRMGARLLLAHTQRVWAQRLWKRGAPHEREQARDLLEEAATTYASLGLPHWERDARGILTD